MGSNPEYVPRQLSTIAVAGVRLLEVFNVLGQRVRHLADGLLPAGIHLVEWDGRDGSGNAVASGVYFYRLRTENQSRARRMVLLK